MPPANPTAPYLAKETPARAPAHAARDDVVARTGGATLEADICIIGAGAGGHLRRTKGERETGEGANRLAIGTDPPKPWICPPNKTTLHRRSVSC